MFYSISYHQNINSQEGDLQIRATHGSSIIIFTYNTMHHAKVFIHDLLVSYSFYQ